MESTSASTISCFERADDATDSSDGYGVDDKLIAKFNCDVQKDHRYRAKQAGIASVHYVRHDRLWVMMATKGLGVFYDEHGCPDGINHQFKVLSREGFRSSGYLVTRRESGYDKKTHTLASIEPETYRDLKGYFLELAVRRKTADLLIPASEYSRQPSKTASTTLR